MLHVPRSCCTSALRGQIFTGRLSTMAPASGGTGGDLRWRSSLRLAPAPPIYEVMGDHGSPPGPLLASEKTRGKRLPKEP